MSELRCSRLPKSRWRTPVLVAAVAAVVASVGLGAPSAWFDEAATASMVRRSSASLVATVVDRTDAVHGLYYLVLQRWADLAGTDIVALRVPSALATVAGAVFVWALATRIRPGRYALVAAAVYIALPTITWAATEARSYSMDAAAATAITLLLLRAVDGGGVARWIAYAVAAALAASLFLYAALVVLAHAAGMLALAAGRRRIRPFLASSSGAGLLVLPLGMLAGRQSAQVSWIPPVGPHTAGAVALQWFTHAPVAAAPGLAMLAVGAVLLVRRGEPGRDPLDAALLIAWLVVPTVVLVLLSAAGGHLYLARYLIVSAPAAALVIAWGVARAGRRTAVVLLAVLIAASVPSYLGQRTPDAKASDWNLAVQRVEMLRGPSTGVYFASVQARAILHAYPSVFEGFADVALRASAASIDRMWDEVVGPEAAVGRTAGLRRLLVVDQPDRDAAATRRSLDAFRAAGFRAVRVLRGPWTTLTELDRS